ncbi:hypothetical protein PCE1_001151 [Barthelona sp. PCE]
MDWKNDKSITLPPIDAPKFRFESPRFFPHKKAVLSRASSRDNFILKKQAVFSSELTQMQNNTKPRVSEPFTPVQPPKSHKKPHVRKAKLKISTKQAKPVESKSFGVQVGESTIQPRPMTSMKEYLGKLRNVLKTDDDFKKVTELRSLSRVSSADLFPSMELAKNLKKRKKLIKQQTEDLLPEIFPNHDENSHVFSTFIPPEYHKLVDIQNIELNNIDPEDLVFLDNKWYERIFPQNRPISEYQVRFVSGCVLQMLEEAEQDDDVTNNPITIIKKELEILMSVWLELVRQVATTSLPRSQMFQAVYERIKVLFTAMFGVVESTNIKYDTALKDFQTFRKKSQEHLYRIQKLAGNRQNELVKLITHFEKILSVQEKEIVSLRDIVVQREVLNNLEIPQFKVETQVKKLKSRLEDRNALIAQLQASVKMKDQEIHELRNLIVRLSRSKETYKRARRMSVAVTNGEEIPITELDYDMMGNIDYVIDEKEGYHYKELSEGELSDDEIKLPQRRDVSEEEHNKMERERVELKRLQLLERLLELHSDALEPKSFHEIAEFEVDFLSFECQRIEYLKNQFKQPEHPLFRSMNVVPSDNEFWLSLSGQVNSNHNLMMTMKRFTSKLVLKTINHMCGIVFEEKFVPPFKSYCFCDVMIQYFLEDNVLESFYSILDIESIQNMRYFIQFVFSFWQLLEIFRLRDHFINFFCCFLDCSNSTPATPSPYRKIYLKETDGCIRQKFPFSFLTLYINVFQLALEEECDGLNVPHDLIYHLPFVVSIHNLQRMCHTVFDNIYDSVELSNLVNELAIDAQRIPSMFVEDDGDIQRSEGIDIFAFIYGLFHLEALRCDSHIREFNNLYMEDKFTFDQFQRMGLPIEFIDVISEKINTFNLNEKSVTEDSKLLDFFSNSLSSTRMTLKDERKVLKQWTVKDNLRIRRGVDFTMTWDDIKKFVYHCPLYFSKDRLPIVSPMLKIQSITVEERDAVFKGVNVQTLNETLHVLNRLIRSTHHRWLKVFIDMLDSRRTLIINLKEKENFPLACWTGMSQLIWIGNRLFLSLQHLRGTFATFNLTNQQTRLSEDFMAGLTQLKNRLGDAKKENNSNKPKLNIRTVLLLQKAVKNYLKRKETNKNKRASKFSHLREAFKSV